MHRPEQPSPGVALPSSHSSLLPTTPSPHRSEEVDPAPASPMVVQFAPSQLASLLNPESGIVFRSCPEPPFAEEDPALEASFPSMVLPLLLSSGGLPQRAKPSTATSPSTPSQLRDTFCDINSSPRRSCLLSSELKISRSAQPLKVTRSIRKHNSGLKTALLGSWGLGVLGSWPAAARLR